MHDDFDPFAGVEALLAAGANPYVGDGNSDGEAFIGLSISCDGFHWSRLKPLI